MKKHREYVINAIETTYSNASVEGNNNIIKK
ncbi:transposase [Peptostreptococcus porci]|nr:transposase [Peptostreptococcus porci]MDY5435461.1 transposase [Peptostreptococcus porci]MDY6232626.1 transposase [Peptostreptococcus porci]